LEGGGKGLSFKKGRRIEVRSGTPYQLEKDLEKLSQNSDIGGGPGGQKKRSGGERGQSKMGEEAKGHRCAPAGRERGP